jgi:NAD(P)H-dependent FMN reductase
MDTTPKSPLKLQVIVGSIRVGRNADAVMKWLMPHVTALGAFEVEVLDLRDWPLPFFQEVVANMGDLRAPTFSDPVVQKWNAKIREADAYVLVTPEYNHSVPAVLKNAIDSVFFTNGFRHKAVGFVGYSLGVTAGCRAVEHLNQIMLETEAMPVRTQALLPFVATAIDAQGRAANPAMDAGAVIMLEDLAWLGRALAQARAQGELPPPRARMNRK